MIVPFVILQADLKYSCHGVIHCNGLYTNVPVSMPKAAIIDAPGLFINKHLPGDAI